MKTLLRALLAAVLLAGTGEAVSACSPPCSGHGGISYYAADWYHCNDGTKEFG